MLKILSCSLLLVLLSFEALGECELARTPDDPFVAAKRYGYKIVSNAEIAIPTRYAGPGKPGWYRFLGALYMFLRVNPDTRLDVLVPRKININFIKRELHRNITRFGNAVGDDEAQCWVGFFTCSDANDERIHVVYSAPKESKYHFVFHP